MKKFRVEIDGEEFMVNIEEVKAEAEVEEKTGAKSSKTNQDQAKTKTVSKSEKKSTKEKIEAADLGKEHIVAPMPGSILEIKVSEGDSVEQGDVLVVLEAMKMENEITATQTGTVKDIRIKTGDSVDAEEVLLLVK